MKILFVNKLFAPDPGGGAEVVLKMLADGLRACGHDVVVVATTGHKQRIDDEVDGVRVIRLPLQNVFWHQAERRHGPALRFLWHALDTYNITMGRRLERVIREVDPDVVCFHNLPGFSASAWASARRSHKPSVQVLHDYYHLCPRSMLFRGDHSCASVCHSCRAFRAGRRSASQGVHAVVGVSRAVLDTHLARGLFGGVPVQAVVKNTLAQAAAPAPREHSERTRTFGFIGTLTESKGIRHLLSAFRRVTPGGASSAGARLLVAGGGEERYVAELRDAFESDRIRFLGRVAPEPFYREIDVLVVPSIWRDPLPTVIAEAKLAGVPSIGARRGGIPELITHDVDGLLYDPDHPTGLEQTLEQVLHTPGLAARLAAGAQTTAREFEGTRRMVDAHLAVYEAAIAVQRAQAAGAPLSD